ncbi:MAG: TIGR04002 family protein [Oscillospiraceae bacterium]|nr:TIGR04002 family protein [Oscillospiraceae bacterium]
MNRPIKRLALSAVLAAMTLALTSLGKIPVGNGYLHLGDSVIYLAACVLPFPYAALAAAVAGALSDALGGYAVYILPTLMIKALITLPFTPKSDTILTRRNAMMVFPAGAITVAGYFMAGRILFGWPGAMAGLPGDTLQAAGSAVLFLVFAAALDKAKLKKTLLRDAGR